MRFRLSWRFVQELRRELMQPPRDAVGVEIAELLPEGLDRHDRFGHRAMAAGTADFGKIAADEFAGILRVPKVPNRNHERIVDEAADDGPPDVLELKEEIGDVGDEVFARQLSKIRAEDLIE